MYVGVLTEDCELGQRAVADDVVGLLLVDVSERHVGDAVALLIVQHVMAMTERAAFDVLARQTHVNAVLEQRAERQRLAHRPVDDAP